MFPGSAEAVWMWLLPLALALFSLLFSMGEVRGETKADSGDGGTGTLLGKVVWADSGAPAAGVTLQIGRNNSLKFRTFPDPWRPEPGSGGMKPVVTVPVGEDGRFRVSGLRPGPFSVAPAPGSPRFPTQEVEVRGEEATELNLRADPGGVVRVRVRTAGGEAAAGARVWLAGPVTQEGGNGWLAAGETSKRLTTDDKGEVLVAALPSGPLAWKAWRGDAGYAEAVMGLPGTSGLPGTVVVSLPEPGQEPSSLEPGTGRLGISFASDPMAPKVVEVVPGRPAARAGLRAGEKLLAIHGATTRWMDRSEFIARLTGEPGSTVVLSVQGEDGRVRTVRVVREGDPQE